LASKFLFTITPGRSGTVFLTQLLRENLSDALVFHERTGYGNFGIDTPDASHFMRFNSEGNSQHIKDFWHKKFTLIKNTSDLWHIEVSHFLSKAGLIENIHLLESFAEEVHIVIQNRDLLKMLWSYVNRFDFANFGFTWLFTLDPRYPNVIVNSEPFMKRGMFGIALWYLIEMECRSEYYSRMLEGRPKIRLHKTQLEELVLESGAKKFLRDVTGSAFETITLPGPQNETRHTMFDASAMEHCKKLIAGFKFEASLLVDEYLEKGLNLAEGRKRL